MLRQTAFSFFDFDGIAGTDFSQVYAQQLVGFDQEGLVLKVHEELLNESAGVDSEGVSAKKNKEHLVIGSERERKREREREERQRERLINTEREKRERERTYMVNYLVRSKQTLEY
jgi:hypothetical protein